MAVKVIISLRREDVPSHAGWVEGRLELELGPDLITNLTLLNALNALPPEADSVEALASEVAKCGVLVVVIGPAWLDARDERGNRCIEDESDFVRIELAAAFKHDVAVIPVLLEGTRMPSPEELPDEIRALVSRNGVEVRHASFGSDMETLLGVLRPLSGHTAAPMPQTGRDQAAVQPIKVDARIAHAASDRWLTPGAGRTQWFKDHEHGPEMGARSPLGA